MNYDSLLTSHSSVYGVPLSQDQIAVFDIYLHELKAWNRKFNLTAIKEDRDIVIKHFLDSLTPLKFIKPGSDLLDIGSGGGFPGIPLKIIEPSLNITLIDSVNKKVTFMRHIIEELELKGIVAIHARAEEMMKTHKSSYDVVISRALTNLSGFIKIGKPFLRPGGILIAMKGARVAEEGKEASEIMDKEGMRIKGIERLSLPEGAGERRIVIIERR